MKICLPIILHRLRNQPISNNVRQIWISFRNDFPRSPSSRGSSSVLPKHDKKPHPEPIKVDALADIMKQKGKPLHRPTEFDGKIFIPFYFFPYVVTIRAVARLKLYQTLLTSVLVPVTLAAHSLGAVLTPSLLVVVFANILALSVLTGSSYFFRRWIGRMYLDESGKEILISHLTFWGKRRDFVMKVKNVEPMDDLPESSKALYLKFRRLDDPNDYYFWSLRAGGILDRDKFVQVFGSIPKD